MAFGAIQSAEHLPYLADSGSVALTWMIFLPLVGAVALFALPKKESVARLWAILVTSATFLYSLAVLIQFRPEEKGIQFAERKAWIPDLGISYIVGIDGLSIWLVVLTTFLSLLVVVASGSVHKNVPGYLGFMLALECGMLGTFLALDGVTFYVFWELMLIPMYFLIGIWGGARRHYAAMKFVLYTAVGSLLMLVAIVYLAYQTQVQLGATSFFLGDWVQLTFTPREEILLFSAFALAFAIKIPLFPLHTWLPDAHVEAPTGGSVILAGVLLKMGLYGLIRFGIPVFPYAVNQARPLLAVLAVVGIVFGALVAWVQTDVKKLVAYSSVSHLGFCVLGFAAMNREGLQGSILQMINHGVSTAALFFLVGVLYDRRHTRDIAEYGGLASRIPLFSAVFLIFTLSSIGLPLTNGFIGEFMILYAGFKFDAVLGTVAVSGVVLGAIYMLSLYRRMVFGPIDESKNGSLTDLTRTEMGIFAPLLVLVFLIGIFPGPFLDRIAPASDVALNYFNGGKQRVREESVYSQKGAPAIPVSRVLLPTR